MASKPGPFTGKTAGQVVSLSLPAPPGVATEPGEVGQQAVPSSSLAASLPFLSVLMGVNYFQRVELESENLSVECLPSIVIHSLACPSAGMSLSSVPKDGAFCGKLHHQKERITSISTCTSQPSPQPRTEEPRASERSAEQPCGPGRFLSLWEMQAFL